LQKLEARRAQEAAMHDMAVVKKEKHNALEIEIAAIKKQDAKRLAALSHKLRALDAEPESNAVLRHTKVQAKAAVKVQASGARGSSTKQGALSATSALAKEAGIKKAFSALAADEKADDRDIRMNKLVQLPHGYEPYKRGSVGGVQKCVTSIFVAAER
jgi:hypothetical protein